MKYKKYFRKTSLKQKGHGDFLLEEVRKEKPNIFLEIGVYHGVTARNICELLYQTHKNDFKYIGLDLFAENEENKNEVIPNNTFNNPLKKIYFKYIKKQNPYSALAVQDLLKKYRQNVEIITGNTNEELKNLNLKNIEYIFIDGGHDFETVKNDLYFCSKFLKSGGTILCDDYDLSQAPGVKQAIDEFISKNDCKFSIIEKRFVKLEF